MTDNTTHGPRHVRTSDLREASPAPRRSRSRREGSARPGQRTRATQACHGTAARAAQQVLETAANAAVTTWRSWPRELLLLSVLYLAYTGSRLASFAPADAANRNARWLLDVERALHLTPDHALNDALYTSPTWLRVASSYYYEALHYIVTVSMLIWLYRKGPAVYRRARNWLVVMTFPALLSFWLFPVAPPRSTPAADAHDIVAAAHGYGWWGAAGGTTPHGLTSLVNENAAMPSLHVGWALWAGWHLVHSARSPVVRAVGYVYPALTVVVVMATGNHYLLDVVAGLSLALVAKVVIDRTAARPRPRARAVLTFAGHPREEVEPPWQQLPVTHRHDTGRR